MEFETPFWREYVPDSDYFGYVPEKDDDRGWFNIFRIVEPNVSKRYTSFFPQRYCVCVRMTFLNSYCFNMHKIQMKLHATQILVTHVYGCALKRRSGLSDDELVTLCCERLADIFLLDVRDRHPALLGVHAL